MMFCDLAFVDLSSCPLHRVHKTDAHGRATTNPNVSLCVCVYIERDIDMRGYADYDEVKRAKEAVK